MIQIYTDGSGNGRYGYFVEDTKQAKIYRVQDKVTNNQAEYLAIIKALEDIQEGEIAIISDNQVVVNQLNLIWHIRNTTLRILAQKVFKLCEGRVITFTWVPRKENKAGKLLG